MRLMVSSVLIMGCGMISTLAWSDSVLLNSGAQYSGTVTVVDEGYVQLRDADGIEMRIPRDKVKRIGMGNEPQASSQPVRPAPQPVENAHAPSTPHEKVALADVLTLPDGAAVTLEGRYGRLRASSIGVQQSKVRWYLNDGHKELVIIGHFPGGISSYSRENWGSLIEVSGTVQRSNGVVQLKAESSKVLRRKASVAP